MSSTARTEPRRIVIIGAAGRDFHNFNVVYRDDPTVRVVAFTAAQIPGIAGRRYPATLAGALYPDGIPIEPEDALEAICAGERVDCVVFAYSDVLHTTVMHLASRALAVGADWLLLGPAQTMLAARVPVVAVSAVRTGAGKSQTARWVTAHLRARGRTPVVIRHPMPYGDLERQRAQRFATRADLDHYDCTIEEREEYEAHLAAGTVVYAGVDYAEILRRAEAESDAIVWDGGNNDFPFVRPNLHLAVLDALRPDHSDAYHPGESVARMADVLIINKVNAATVEQVATAEAMARRLNPHATIVHAASPVTLAAPDAVRGRRVLVVDDGPTLTHGGMPYGAGYIAARDGGAAEIIDPRPYAVPAIHEALQRYPHIGHVLPALGYDADQLDALRASITATPADVVVSGTPIDLAALIDVPQPIVRARYAYADAGTPTLRTILDQWLDAPAGAARA